MKNNNNIMTSTLSLCSRPKKNHHSSSLLEFTTTRKREDEKKKQTKEKQNKLTRKKEEMSSDNKNEKHKLPPMTLRKNTTTIGYLTSGAGLGAMIGFFQASRFGIINCLKHAAVGGIQMGLFTGAILLVAKGFFGSSHYDE